MLVKSLSLSKCTCIQFDSLILGDKNDMNVFQDIQILLRNRYALNVANEKKALNNALAIISYLIIHVKSAWQGLVSY